MEHLDVLYDILANSILRLQNKLSAIQLGLFGNNWHEIMHNTSVYEATYIKQKVDEEISLIEQILADYDKHKANEEVK